MREIIPRISWLFEEICLEPLLDLEPFLMTLFTTVRWRRAGTWNSIGVTGRWGCNIGVAILVRNII